MTRHKVVLSAELFSKLEKLLFDISNNKQLDVSEQQKASELLDKIQKKVTLAHKERKIKLPANLVISILNLLAKLISSEDSIKLLYNLFFQGRR